MNLLHLEQIGKIYTTGDRYHTALHPVDLNIGQGEFVAITGPSGGGKSTLLSILGCLNRPDRGRYWIQNQVVNWRSDRQLANLRGGMLATIFQGFELLEHWTVLENVELGLRFRHVPTHARSALILSSLRQVGLLRMAHKYPSELSGGEQQRVAIARALCASPKVLLADEPTGNLDPETAKEIVDVLLSLHAQGLTLLLVTHDRHLAQQAQRILTISGGRLVHEETRNENVTA